MSSCTQIVPQIVRSYPTDCPSVMRCTVFSDDFCFRALLLRFLGLGFILSPRFMEINFSVLWLLCVLSGCVRCLTPLWVPIENGMIRLESRYFHDTIRELSV